jgi:uncharacterized protein with HEPN domain
MSKRALELLLNDILQCAENIFEYTEGLTYSNFIDDRKTVDAVVRNMEIIGEASNRFPMNIKLK